MDLRLPPLPDLLQPNLLAGIAPSYSSVPRTDAGGDAKELLPQGSVPPYLEKLLQLQKLQDEASVSFLSASQHPAHTAALSALVHSATHPQQSYEISGAELAPMLTQHWHSPPEQHQAFALGSSVSNSFVEVDEEYLADPPLLELGGDSVSSSTSLSLYLQPDAPPAVVVPVGIVAQRRKSLSDQAAAASASQRAPSTPDALVDNASAGYVKSIVQKQMSAAENASHASMPLSASTRRLSVTKGGAAIPALPSLNEPSAILAPNLIFNLAPNPVYQQPSSSHSQVFAVMPEPTAVEALSEPLYSGVAQLEQLSETSIKEFFIHVVDMIDSSSTAARARAMVALCNFLSKGKHRDKINMEGLVVLLPKLLRFLPADKNTVMNDDETYLAGATSGTICNLSSSSAIRQQCCDMGFLAGLVALVSQNDVFSTRHATGALWNLVVENNSAKLLLVRDEAFCKKLVELFNHSDIQVCKHALGLASEMCCKNVQVKELFCDDYRMQLLKSIVVECSGVDVAVRVPKLRSCCLLVCNVLANSPANKSLALQHNLFDAILPLFRRDDAELCAVVAGIVVNLPPWRSFRSNIKRAGLIPVIECHAGSKNESLARNSEKLIQWLVISKKHKQPFFVKAPKPVNMKLTFGQ